MLGLLSHVTQDVSGHEEGGRVCLLVDQLWRMWSTSDAFRTRALVSGREIRCTVLLVIVDSPVLLLFLTIGIRDCELMPWLGVIMHRR